ncbi:MAG: type II toxin-antitoxin system RelE/ParE family toxin [Alphaproteobacteria bacterium]|nr:type II toxin-antitoxin system RelE/ParE family toxin [Alphaproteobacteria bacterium]
MAFHLEFSAAAERDLELIFDHLFESYAGFGERPDDAVEHATARILEIRSAAGRILTAPRRGERHDDILPGLRHLALGRAIYWFEVDEGRETVRVLGVFFGGQDHIRRMLARLVEAPDRR